MRLLHRARHGIVALLFAMMSLPVHAQVDLEGGWAARQHEDAPERGGGPDIGDYTGLPINDANRRRGDSWSASPGAAALVSSKTARSRSRGTRRGSGSRSQRMPTTPVR